MYLIYNKKTKKVLQINEKPFFAYNKNLCEECYIDSLPARTNAQYFTVSNVREETRIIKEAYSQEETYWNEELGVDEVKVVEYPAETETYLTCDILVKDRPQPSEEALLLHKLSKLREKRKPLLEAFDKWEKAVLRGREQDSQEIMNWYRDLLDLKEFAFKNIPERVNYFIN